MTAPYGRLMVLHITIIIGGMAIAMTGAPSAAVLILVLLKTALDLGLHLAEHRLGRCHGDSRPAHTGGLPVTLRLGASVPVTRVAFDPRFDRLVPDGTPITPHADGAIWAEGPVYVPDEDAVLWSDVRSNAVRRWSDADGDSIVFQPSDFANGHTLDHDGTVLACEHGRRRISRYERDGTRSTVVDRFGAGRFNSPNDIVVASDGAIWFTDPPYGILDDSEGYKADSEQDGCFVYRVDRASGEVTVASRDLVHPNGLAFSPDESVMYVSDTSIARPAAGTTTCSHSTSPTARRLVRPRVFCVMEPGVSDGFRVDVDGNVWTSAGDGIHVLDADGVELGRIILPEEASNCQFGGPDGRRLFITATSTLWSLPVGIRGVVTPWVKDPTSQAPRRRRGRPGSGARATRARRSARPGSDSARIAAARRPALVALPMATVATGTPRGIWTIDSSESRPPRCWVGIGTPMTGRAVLAASIPGGGRRRRRRRR